MGVATCAASSARAVDFPSPGVVTGSAPTPVDPIPADRMAEFVARLADFESRLQAASTTLDGHRVRIEATDTTFTGIETSIAATDTALTAQSATVTTHGEQLDAHQATLDTHGTRLDGHDTTMAEHGTRLGAMETTLQSHASMLGDHGLRLETQTQTAAAHGTRLDDHSATLETHGTRMDGHDTTLEAHEASLAAHGGRLDEQEQRGASIETRLEGQESRLTREVGRLDTQVAEADGHGVRLDEHETRVGNLEGDATQQAALVAAHSRRLSALEAASGGTAGVTLSRPLADTGMESLQNALAAQQTALDGVGRDIEDLRSGVAMALALGGVAVGAQGAFAVELASGFYGTYSAVALQGGVRVTDWLIVDGGVAYGVDAGDFGGVLPCVLCVEGVVMERLVWRRGLYICAGFAAVFCGAAPRLARAASAEDILNDLGARVQGLESLSGLYEDADLPKH